MPESCISNNFPVGNTSNKWLVTFIAHIQMAKSNFPVFWLHVKNRTCMEIAKDGIYKSLDKDQYFHLTYLWWCFPVKWKFVNIMLNKTAMFWKLQRIISNFVAHTIKCAVCAAKRMFCKWFDVKKFKNKFVCLGLNGSIGQSVKGHTMTNVHRDRAPTAAVIRMLKHAHFVLVKNWYCLSFVCK